MRRFIVGLTALSLAVSSCQFAVAGVSGKVMDRFERSGQVMQEMIGAPDKGIPKGMLDHARCVAVVPSLKKGGLGVGARFGHGFVTCRRGMTGTFGFQIGLESVDVVLLFVNQRGVEKLLQDQFSLGGDASISAGPIGRTAEAGTDILLRSEIYSYARSRGLFAGVALGGARMYQDGDVNKDLYGHEIKPQDILIAQKVGMPPGAAHLIGVLNKYSPRAPYVKK